MNTEFNFAVLYDGTHVAIAQKKWKAKGIGKLSICGFHEWLQKPFQETGGKLFYAGWHQGIRCWDDRWLGPDDDLLLTDHSRFLDNVEKCGIALHWKPLKRVNPESEETAFWKERQVDVALTVDALRLHYEENITSFLIVTGDMDYVPLIRQLVEKSCQVIVAGFYVGRSPYHTQLNQIATKYLDLTSLLANETSNPKLFSPSK